ncbi:MAG: sterol desaturase family protein [Acidobacteriota bacterium]
MHDLDTNAYYALGVPLYACVALLEHALARRNGERAYSFAVTIGNLSGGLGEVVIGLFLGPLLFALYLFAYRHYALVHWHGGSLVPWILAFVLGDFCYYWYHRAGHRFAGLWAIHGVHHQSEELNLTVALRNPWFSDTYSALFYAPLPLAGVPPGHFFIAISIISFYALTVHSRHFHRPSLWLLVTPATHIVHHAKNPRYVGRNLGAMFTVWDRMFGTHVEVDPAEAPRLGTSFGYETHDGALAQWIFFGKLLETARLARSWREKVLVFVRRPGWRPAGVTRPSPRSARRDAEIPLVTKLHAAVQFSLVSVFSLEILWRRDHHPTWVLIASSAVILASIATIGGMLDGRTRARAHEGVRLACLAGLGIAMAGAGYALTATALVLGATIGAGTLVAAPEAEAPVRS